MATRRPDFLAHRPGDSVAVAVRDLPPGPAEGGYLNTSGAIQVELTAAIPLGHKVALVDLPEGADVVEYGVRIAVASQPISVGNTFMSTT